MEVEGIQNRQKIYLSTITTKTKQNKHVKAMENKSQAKKSEKQRQAGRDV